MLVLPVFSSSIKVLWCLQRKVGIVSLTLIEEEKTGNINFTLKTPKDFNRSRVMLVLPVFSSSIKVLWCLQRKVGIVSLSFFD
jgi:hypothetical protein